MRKLTSALAFECANLPQGFQAVNKILESCDLDVLEASQMAPGKFVAILAGPRGEIERAQKMEVDVAEIAAFAEFAPTVAEALFSLNATKLQDAMLVLQIASIPKILQLCHQALVYNSVELVEIRTYRACPGSCCAILTGPAAELKLLQASFAREPQAASELIEKTAPRFRQFYNLPGEE